MVSGASARLGAGGRRIMSKTTSDRTSRRASRSLYIGGSEIRPIRRGGSTGRRDGEVVEQDGTGTFTPGGGYHIDKYPALKRLVQDWERQ
jgi:hypothetical protein